MFNRSLVVVPVDGSPETEATVQYAASIAKRHGADVHVIQVVSRGGGTLWRAPESERRVRARLRTLRPAVEQEGVLVRIVTLRGDHGAIAAYAQLHAESLIVVAHHYGSSRLWRHSRIASRLSRTSPVPVLVVPALGAAAPHSVNRILAAVEFTVSSAIALRAAADWSRRHGARLTMVHALGRPLDQMALSGGEAWRLVQRLPAEVRAVSRRLTRKAATLGSAGAAAVVVTGNAFRAIVATAKDSDADLIVMGVAPRSRFDEAVFGSTLRAVLSRATVPVLVVPVVGGAHEWIDAVEEDMMQTRALNAESARHAA